MAHFLPFCTAAVDIAFLRADFVRSAGREPAPEMLPLLALVIYDDYELFPAKETLMPHPDVQMTPTPGNDPRKSSGPDRSQQYTDASPVKLRDQLNENWRQMRIFKTAIDDRDRTIGTLHTSVKERDTTIKLLNGKLSYSRVKVAMLYALVGGAAAEGAKEGVLALLHWLGTVVMR